MLFLKLLLASANVKRTFSSSVNFSVILVKSMNVVPILAMTDNLIIYHIIYNTKRKKVPTKV